VQNSLYENKFDLHENEHVGGTYFHMNGLHEDSWPVTSKKFKVNHLDVLGYRTTREVDLLLFKLTP